MRYPIATISILLLLVVSAYSHPENSDESLGLTGNLFNIAKDVINSVGNFFGGSQQTDAESHEDTNFNPDESGEYFQGDMVIPDPELRVRNGLKDTRYRWPNAVIPYKISPGFNAEQQRTIREAMDEFHRTTCIRFRPYSISDRDYINIISNQIGCWSHVGRIGGKQDVNLQVPACVYYKGTVVHELMHTIGFYHEQSRSDRDNYVNIMWQNIQPKQQHNFDKYNPSQIDALGVGYDYDSIMHYSSTAFSRGMNLPTIVPKFAMANAAKLGQRNGLSYTDMMKIRRMYRCYNQNWNNY